MINEAAKGFGDASAAGMRALVVGAVFLHLKDANKVNMLALQSAIAEKLAMGDIVSDKHLATARNYASKCKAAAMPEHFFWTVNVNNTLEDTVDAILPEFRAYWGAVNNIRRAGPEMRRTLRKTDMALQQAQRRRATPQTTSVQTLATELVQRLSERLPDNSGFALSAATLAEIRDAVTAELAARRQELQTEPAAQAA